MPIKGVTDATRLPRVGKIHLGEKAVGKSGAPYPTPVDYFLVRADDTTPEEAVILASIVEKETGRGARYKVASHFVVWSRVRQRKSVVKISSVLLMSGMPLHSQDNLGSPG